MQEEKIREDGQKREREKKGNNKEM